MYDPEANFTANLQFDEIIERVNLFTERMVVLAGDDTQKLGDKLKSCIELLRRKHEEYLNEFDPYKKEQLHANWQRTVVDFMVLMKGMVENL